MVDQRVSEPFGPGVRSSPKTMVEKGSSKRGTPKMTHFGHFRPISSNFRFDPSRNRSIHETAKTHQFGLTPISTPYYIPYLGPSWPPGMGPFPGPLEYPILGGYPLGKGRKTNYTYNTQFGTLGFGVFEVSNLGRVPKSVQNGSEKETQKGRKRGHFGHPDIGGSQAKRGVSARRPKPQQKRDQNWYPFPTPPDPKYGKY